MKNSDQYEIGGLGLASTEYTVEQTGMDKNLRPEYEAVDVTGDTIFQCTYNMYEGKDTFPFVDDADDELFTVKASEKLDIAGDYVLTEKQADEPLVVLDNDISLMQDTWRIRDADDGPLLAKITSRGGLITLARKLLPVGQFIGHKFEIADADGNSVGAIESDLAVHDHYDITISDASSVPIDPIVAAAVVIDGIQGN